MCALLYFHRLLQNNRFSSVGPCLALLIGMIEIYTLASVCGVAVFFMVGFLYALLREALTSRVPFTEIRFMERRETIRRAPLSAEHSHGCLNRAA
jgi:hypothetical protein